MHWKLDYIFHIDACRARHANLQTVLSLLRKLALAIHRQYMTYLKAVDIKQADRKSMRHNMRHCRVNFDQLLDVLKHADLTALVAEKNEQLAALRRSASNTKFSSIATILQLLDLVLDW